VADLPPYPDRAHEALRTELLAQIDAAEQNAAGVDDSYFLTDTLFDLADSLLAQINALNIRCDALQIDRDTAFAAIGDLQARVTALEAPDPPAGP
jgi:hypothetical protein